MASIEKRTRNGKTTYRVRYRDPSGRQRSKVFSLKRDADRWMAENEAAKLPGRVWVDPAAGRERVRRVGRAVVRRHRGVASDDPPRLPGPT